MRFVFEGAVGGGSIVSGGGIVSTVEEEEEFEFCASSDRYASGMSKRKTTLKVRFKEVKEMLKIKQKGSFMISV